MTDGIIQQVFTIFKNYSNTKQCKQDIIDLEKELITRIKNYEFDSDKYFDDTIKTQLIGDNIK